MRYASVTYWEAYFPLSNQWTDFYMMGRLALNRLGRINAAPIQTSYYTLPTCFWVEHFSLYKSMKKQFFTSGYQKAQLFYLSLYFTLNRYNKKNTNQNNIITLHELKHIIIYYIKAPQQSQKLNYQKIYFYWNHLVNWELKKWNFSHQ